MPKHNNIINMEKYYEYGPIYEVQKEGKTKRVSKAVAIFILECAEHGTLIDNLLAGGKMGTELSRAYFSQMIAGL